jgi:hypothetical protein
MQVHYRSSIRAIGTGFLVSMDMYLGMCVCTVHTTCLHVPDHLSHIHTALVPTSTAMHDRFDIGEIDE